DVISQVNLQHDCSKQGCTHSGVQYVMQEHQKSQVTRKVIKHVDDSHFIVNMGSLHNYQHIERAIP
ncbi:hypothetical protein BOTBODRAFT_94896, partial [Botryobasidium botryosum FD-172 SS1]